MNTNPNLLDTSVIFNNTISIKEFEELFFNNERLPLFKSFLSKMIDSGIQPYDFFGNLSNKEGIINSEGKWILDSEYKHYPIEMDMSFSLWIFI